MPSAIDRLADKLERGRAPALTLPKVKSFREFLETQARVRLGKGEYGPYSFEGREALIEIVDTIDLILGSETAKPLADARCALAGGAQFGKTVLELNLAAYLTSCKFLNVGVYLPDDDLVQGVVDTKFRPEVVDQIDWFANMVQVGKTLNKSGRAVNRKGAFLVTDGNRTAQGMIRGLGKVPTTFSMDVALEDEVDDIKPEMEKFVEGRLTSSEVRAIMRFGTQRIFGRGMQKAWADGSQGVMSIQCPECRTVHNAEESFPGIVRLPISGSRQHDDPVLTYHGDFRTNELIVGEHKPDNSYYLACPDCGASLDRHKIFWTHKRPERIEMRNWSWRISQLGIPAIDLQQIVGSFVKAVDDPEKMIVFRCDRQALPQSGAQALTPEILQRSREVEPYNLSIVMEPERIAYAGLDMGDRCWLFVRNADPITKERKILDLARISSGDVVARVQMLFAQLGIATLLIDERPLVNEARTLALILNGLHGLTDWPKVPTNKKEAYIALPGGLAWDGKDERWIKLKCAIVRFSKQKLGAGIVHNFAEFEESGMTKFVPLIEANRYETIDRAVREFLTPKENVQEIVNGEMRELPAMRLPVKPAVSPILDELDAHLITGSEREKEEDGSLGDYVDGVDNHLLLADGYSALAELVGEKRLPSGTVRDVAGIRMGGQRSPLAKFIPRRLRRS
jgi:Phage terminase large subunit gpA, ATPase domain